MRKYHIVLFFVFIFININIFSEDYSFEGQSFRYNIYFTDFDNPGFKFCFEDNTFSIDIPELEQSKIEEGHYIKEIKKSTYKLEEKESFVYLNAIDKNFLVLYYKNILCALVDCEDNTTYFGVNEKSEYVSLPSNPLRTRDVWIGIGDVFSKDAIKFSSCLTENTIRYDNKNKYSWQLKTPWVEGISRSGIGEWIEKSYPKRTNKIVLLNGYVDLNHLDYYYKNERIKDIEVLIDGDRFYYTLEDSPQLQVIELPRYYKGVFKITIKSVYAGTKYADTCLSLFLFLDERGKQL